MHYASKENKPGHLEPFARSTAAATGKTMCRRRTGEFAGQGYGVFKPAVGEAVIEKHCVLSGRRPQRLMSG